MTDDSEPQTTIDETEDDLPGRYRFFIDWAIRGSEALRKHLAVDEEMFLTTPGHLVADPRAYFLYAALDECQKAGIHLMRLEQTLGGEEVIPHGDRESRLVVEYIAEEQRARERKLIELLISLILFSSTNETAYFRHFLLLEDLEDILRANEDQEEFHGATSTFMETRIQTEVAQLVDAQRDVDFARAWYLGNGASPVSAGPTNQKQLLSRHVRFSSVRARVRRALPLMTSGEKLCTGTTYADAYGAPSEAVHFGVGSGASGPQIDDPGALGTKIGLIVAAILNRVHQLLGRPDTPLVSQLSRVLERGDNENAATLIERLTNRGLQVGDFVLAYGYLAEILEVRTSKYGNRAYHVLYLAERPLKNLDQDWLPARYVEPFYTGKQAAAALQDISEKEGMSAATLELLKADAAGWQGALRSSIVELWPMLKTAMRKRKVSRIPTESTRADPGTSKS